MKPGTPVTCQCGNVMAVPRRGGTPWLWIVLGVVGVTCMCSGVLAAIAIPNFMRFQARAKQAECNTNLRSFYTAQRMQNLEGAGYVREFSKVSFMPERGNRYAYFVDAKPMEDRGGAQAQGGEEARAIGVDTFRYKDAKPITFAQLPPDVAQQTGLLGECPECNITMACAGNLDGDDTLDVWSISTGERTLPTGTIIPPGEAFHHVDDVKEEARCSGPGWWRPG